MTFTSWRSSQQALSLTQSHAEFDNPGGRGVTPHETVKKMQCQNNLPHKAPPPKKKNIEKGWELCEHTKVETIVDQSKGEPNLQHLVAHNPKLLESLASSCFMNSARLEKLRAQAPAATDKGDILARMGSLNRIVLSSLQREELAFAETVLALPEEAAIAFTVQAEKKEVGRECDGSVPKSSHRRQVL